MVPLSTRICARTVIGSGDDAMPGEGLFSARRGISTGGDG